MSNEIEIRKLSHKQQIVIQELLGGAKVTEACKTAKVDRTTFYVWANNDELFQEELQRRRSEVIEESMERLRALMHRAVTKLETLLNSKMRKSAGRRRTVSLNTH